ncbi:site-specific integrase [Endozoicomonas euniceicola]|uniref:Site-specific integrase n=1 Tax=Endozoicomonas euniceicola TaxID=1234143 RepID=A0ABY6GU50_9GAMM|nr:site-specific integrase [Endozoicomonas euniceicola]UYM16312.1 site-specific integrase [Endozoicomonas euniceicola]
MPVNKFFTEIEIKELIFKNSTLPFGYRNAALILGAVYWGLTPSELSLLRLKDVMHEEGVFYKAWIVPESIAYNGFARELQTSDKILPFFEKYMKWRSSFNIFPSSSHLFRHSQGQSPFFINDIYRAYKLSPSKTGNPDSQAKSMSNKLMQLIGNANINGATPSTFRDTFVREMYKKGCQYNELKLVSGIRKKETIDRKISPNEIELCNIYQSIFT